MEDYIQITVRKAGKDESDIDIRVHRKQVWDVITDTLCENNILKEPGAGFTYKSLRRQKCFDGGKSSEEEGIYTGDIIELLGGEDGTAE